MRLPRKEEGDPTLSDVAYALSGPKPDSETSSPDCRGLELLDFLMSGDRSDESSRGISTASNPSSEE